MFETFADGARRVVVLAQEEARMLGHDHIGTEHILLGLIREGEGVAAKALESLGIGLEAVRQQVGEIIGQDQQAPPEHLPFTPRAKKVLELSLREALEQLSPREVLRLRNSYIGTEHILLGLIREGEGVAARVLVGLGASLNGVRQQVIQLLHDHRGEEPEDLHTARPERGLLPGLAARVDAIDLRLSVVEGRTGTGPDTGDLDQQIEQVQHDTQAAIAAQEYERAAALRDRGKGLLAEKASRRQQSADAHPDLLSLAGQVRQLSEEVERLRALLREHGIEPGAGAA